VLIEAMYLKKKEKIKEKIDLMTTYKNKRGQCLLLLNEIV